MQCNRPIKVWKPMPYLEEKQIVFNRPDNAKDYEEIEIPCGHCTACKLNHANEWAVRCSIETKYNNYSYFITLTYDEEHLFYTADQKLTPSLNKKHIQDFIKKLRKHYNLRYFCAGEYGPKTGRPHYHMIIWTDSPISDLKGVLRGISIEASKSMGSDQITRLWGKGGVLIQHNNFNTAAYVAKYTLKKQKDNGEQYEDYGLNKPFLLMSTKPMIGEKILEEQETIKSDRIVIPITNDKLERKTKISKLPKKVMEKLKDQDSELYEKIKQQRYLTGKRLESGMIRQTEIKDKNLIREYKEEALKASINRNKL